MASTQAPDPRSTVTESADGVRLVGVRCSSCGYAVAGQRPRCPVCHADVVAAAYGPEGVVWAATVVRIPVPGRTPPYGLAYVDLVDGPRVLVHTSGAAALAVGASVRLVAKTAAGDLAAVPA